MKSIMFHGSPEEVESKIGDFIADKEKTIKVHAFTQSQSTINESSVYVVTTLIYTPFEKKDKPTVGFHTGFETSPEE